MITKLFAVSAFTFLCAFNFQLSIAHAQGTAFSYQGRLSGNGSPASGSYDLQFTLYTTNITGTALAGPVTNTAVAVTNGLFTTLVNFGPGVFTGMSNWLQLAVSTNGANNFSTLAPRQQVTPTPYALYAGSANASNLVGTVPATQLPANVLTNGATGVNLSGTFNFTGGGPTNLSGWLLNGNSGTTNGNYLGTTDNQPLEIRVAGARAALISPSNGLPNIVFGTAQNIISNTTAGASILGGGGNMVQAGSSYSVIGGGSGNTIQIVDDHSVIVGGINNSIQAGANLSVLGGGQGNVIGSSAFASFLGSGIGNQIMSGASYSVIGGGNANQIQANAFESAVGGGNGNTIGSGSVGSFIGSGIDNNIQPNDIYSVLVGGNENVIWTGAPFSFLGGGQFNYLQTGATNSVLGGGTYNVILAGNSFLGGGNLNTISNNAMYAVLAGGIQNGVGGSYATVPGGSNNVANGANSFAAGTSARATNSGAFVWSDVEGTPFTSTNANSFNVRANGGVRLVTGGAGLTVDGQPVLAGSISLAQLPAGVVTNNEPNVSLGNLTLGGSLNLNGYDIYSGASTLLYNDNNRGNFFTGAGAGNVAATGAYNTANGSAALAADTSGYNNTAQGASALQNNTSGYQNTAVGVTALYNNLWGNNNAAYGWAALYGNTSGSSNIAVGSAALSMNTAGSNNVAVGSSALGANTTGFNNIGIGSGAGNALTTGSNNIDIGNAGNNSDSGVIRIGTPGVQTQAFIAGAINGNGSGLTNLSVAQITSGGQPVITINDNGDTYLGMKAASFSFRGFVPLGDQSGNVAVGLAALEVDANTSINAQNTAIGSAALFSLINDSGENTAVGSMALFQNKGGGENIAIGYLAGANLDGIEDHNIDIGNYGVKGENAIIRIGDPTIQTATYLAGTVYANGVALTSDRNAKENFQPVDNQAVLAKLAALSVTQWNYKTDQAGVQHIGPMAQDFQAAFKLDGTDDKHISVVDEGGVALAAIQGLNQKLEAESKAKDAEIQALKQSVAELTQLIQNIAERK